MSPKHQPPTLSLRRPSAARVMTSPLPPEPTAPESALEPPVLEEPIAAPPALVEPAPPPPAPAVTAPPVILTAVTAPAVIAPSVIAPKKPVEPPAPTVAPPPTRPLLRVGLSREAERLTKEAESDFFVSIPQSRKTALKTYCVQHGISMRDWLLGVLDEKGIGAEAGAKRGGSR